MRVMRVVRGGARRRGRAVVVVVRCGHAGGFYKQGAAFADEWYDVATSTPPATEMAHDRSAIIAHGGGARGRG